MTSYTDSDLSSSVEDSRQSTPPRSASKKYSIAKNTIHGRLQGLRPRTESHPEIRSLSPEREERLQTWVSRQEGLGFALTHAQVSVLAASLAKKPKERSLRGKKRKKQEQLLKRHADLDTKLGRRTESARVRAGAREIIHKLVKAIDSHRAHLLLQKEELVSLRAQLDELRRRKKRQVQTGPNELSFAPYAAMLAQRGSTAETSQDTEDESAVVEEREGVEMQTEEEEVPSYPSNFLRPRTYYIVDL